MFYSGVSWKSVLMPNSFRTFLLTYECPVRRLRSIFEMANPLMFFKRLTATYSIAVPKQFDKLINALSSVTPCILWIVTAHAWMTGIIRRVI